MYNDGHTYLDLMHNNLIHYLNFEIEHCCLGYVYKPMPFSTWLPVAPGGHNRSSKKGIEKGWSGNLINFAPHNNLTRSSIVP